MLHLSTHGRPARRADHAARDRAGQGDALPARAQPPHRRGRRARLRAAPGRDEPANNRYAAFDRSGRSRGPSHSTRAFRRAWRRSALILRCGPVAVVDAKLRRSACRTSRATQRIFTAAGRAAVGPADEGSPRSPPTRRARTGRAAATSTGSAPTSTRASPTSTAASASTTRSAASRSCSASGRSGEATTRPSCGGCSVDRVARRACGCTSTTRARCPTAVPPQPLPAVASGDPRRARHRRYLERP